MITKIEKFEYLDMDDPKNSWYFDAERFDVNFPLVCSYGSNKELGSLLLGVYNYFNEVLENYRLKKDLCVLVVESKYPNEYESCRVDDKGNLIKPEMPELFSNKMRAHFPDYDKDGFVDPMFSMGVDSLAANILFFPGRKFKFTMCERIGPHYYLRFLVCVEHGFLEDFKSKFFHTKVGGPYPMTGNRGFPYLQTITTQDWDLLKRYFFFMIRNHQYKYADLTYYLTCSQYRAGNYPDFMTDDVFEAKLSNLPEDLRGSDKLRL